MRFTNLLVVFCCAWLAGSRLGEARQFRPWLPDEMEPQAILICTGAVLSIQSDGPPRDIVYSEMATRPQREIVMVAKIKPLAVFKGRAPDEFEFRYRVSSPEVPEIDGLMHVHLKVGARYRFFLKPDDAPGRYVSVLDGHLDDRPAIETLLPSEPDNSPFLRKDEVIELARDFLRSRNLESTVDWGRPIVSCFGANMDGSTRSVVLHRNPPAKGVVLIVIRGDRTVDIKQSKLQD